MRRPTGLAVALLLTAFCCACGKNASETSSGTGGAGGEGGAPPTPIASLTDVAVGVSHSCVIAEPGGRVICWGSNVYGQVTSIPGSIAEAPTEVPSIEGAVELALGESDTCMRRADGSVRCWGQHALTEGADQLSDIVHIAVGTEQACAIVADGSVHCWTQSPSDPHQSTPPAQVTGVAGARTLALGHTHACALLDGGTVWCWGSNASGQLGNPAAVGSDPIEVAGIDDAQVIATAMSEGSVGTCVVRAGGTVACWGNVPYAPTALTMGPEEAGFPATAAGVVVGSSQVCAIAADGAASCMPDDNCLPTEHRAWAKLALRATHACAIGGSGEVAGDAILPADVACWGNDEFGQLGGGRVGSGCVTGGRRVVLPGETTR